MTSDLTAALVTAAVAWAGVLLAALLPVPDAAFDRLRWVGAAAIGFVALSIVGVDLPGYLPGTVLIGGATAALAWSARRGRAVPA